VARKKKKRSRKKAAARRKFSTPSQTRAQLEGITAAQLRYRRARRKQSKIGEEATETVVEGIIIDSREKSEQAWKNALRAVRRPEDLDGFD
jgi:polyhydroxyalkanoate synthesis regulator protein